MTEMMVWKAVTSASRVHGRCWPTSRSRAEVAGPGDPKSRERMVPLALEGIGTVDAVEET